MGNDVERPISASGRPGSLMHEAIERGLRTGLINSGSIIEPGTACYVASVKERDDFQEITKQVLESGVDVILSGGEEWFLPEGTKGRHVASGLRKDGLDLVETARKLGYHTVYNREELMAVPEQTKKLLGIFAARNTFNDMPEGKMRESGLPTYDPQAPTLAEMTAAALKILAPGPFFLIVEEEGVDNFGNCNNGLGVLDSLKRADDALAVGIDFLKNNNETLLVTTGDSSAGAMDVLSFLPTPARLLQASKGQDLNGAPYSLAADGSPFLSQPDRSGVRHPFVLTWGSQHDASGGILVRAAGKDASKVRGTFDNTQIYQLMRETLFGDK
jgi:alkaline phosphatase